MTDAPIEPPHRMAVYPFLVETTEDDVFMAYAPDLPGCTAAGTTMDELRINAADALRDWLEEMAAQGGDIPRPFSSNDFILVKAQP